MLASLLLFLYLRLRVYHSQPLESFSLQLLIALYWRLKQDQWMLLLQLSALLRQLLLLGNSVGLILALNDYTDITPFKG